MSHGINLLNVLPLIEILGDLFDILLPMLTIYQEYVRNHHYSLQVLTECKQNPAFVNLLERLENKPACHARSLENFLIVPMHQVSCIKYKIIQFHCNTCASIYKYSYII